MSLRDRLLDSQGFVLPGERVPSPHFAQILLADLGLSRATKRRQIEGIRGWLAKNEPSESLLASIQEEGFSAALPVGQRHTA